MSDAVQAVLKYAPAAVIGWLPDHTWVPSVSTIMLSGKPAGFVNAGGIVFYFDSDKNREDVVLATALLTARVVSVSLPRLYYQAKLAVQKVLAERVRLQQQLATVSLTARF